MRAIGVSKGKGTIALCLAMLISSQFNFSSETAIDMLLQREVGNAVGNTTGNATRNATIAIATEWREGKIPKIVHQEWKSRELPPNFKVWNDECIAQNPDWEFRLWTDDDNLKLVEEHYPQLLKLYHNYTEKIKRIDMIRFLYLHKFGGVYMDLDIICVRPFGNYFDQFDDKFLIVNQFGTGKKVEYANAFMASPPRHDVFKTIFHELPLRQSNDVLEATGGLFLQLHVLNNATNKGNWVQLPFEEFYAQDWKQSLKQNKDTYDVCHSFEHCRMRYQNAMTVSMWTGTWAGGNDTAREWYDVGNITYLSNFCGLCLWDGNIYCNARIGYLMGHYKVSEREAVESLTEKNMCLNSQ
mmetsp:Transcript_27782/g.58700  ORF Transcript_27782/g.58700 Transcript_27782/m.58700 type:complete len:355 (+) Transcript_27782:147-1211(+)